LSFFTGIAILAALIRQSTEIPKVLAFDGVFEKLFAVVTREGGLEAQTSVADALRCVDTLLRFNPSNQVNSSEFVKHCISSDRAGSELLPRDGSPFATLHPALLQPKHTAGRSCSSGIRAAILE
jgi:hypothetical protein